MSGESFLQTIDTAARCLTGLGVKFALVGGAALPAWGRIRATEDADIILYPEPAGDPPGLALNAVVRALRDAGFAHLDRADSRQLDDKRLLFFWFPVRP